MLNIRIILKYYTINITIIFQNTKIKISKLFALKDSNVNTIKTIKSEGTI